MVAFLPRQRLIVPFALLAAALLAVLVSLIVVLLPSGILELLAVDSGIAAVIPAAEPPLGATARAVLALAGGGGVGLIAWFALVLLLGGRTIAIGASESHVLRRADAHPDAPPRQPVFATRDLGTPFLEVHAPRPLLATKPAERRIPVDLDMPLAAFDPAAIPDAPVSWAPPPPLPPLPRPLPVARPQIFDAGDRFETFALTPARAETPAEKPIEPGASIHSLLERLERSVGRHETPAERLRDESFEQALTALRRLATRA